VACVTAPTLLCSDVRHSRWRRYGPERPPIGSSAIERGSTLSSGSSSCGGQKIDGWRQLIATVGMGTGCTLLWMLTGTTLGAASSSLLPLQSDASRQHARSTAGFFKHVSPSTASSHERRLPSPLKTGHVPPGQSVPERQPFPALPPPEHLPFCCVMRASMVHEGPETAALPHTFFTRLPHTPSPPFTSHWRSLVHSLPSVPPSEGRISGPVQYRLHVRFVPLLPPLPSPQAPGMRRKKSTAVSLPSTVRRHDWLIGTAVGFVASTIWNTT